MECGRLPYPQFVVTAFFISNYKKVNRLMVNNKFIGGNTNENWYSKMV